MEDRISLHEKLKINGERGPVPMHMPGHKRNESFNPYHLPIDIDITEIDGFDNMNHPEEILKDNMDRVRSLYGSRESYYLVNGSTCGILAGIRACVSYGDKVIMSRHAHKSVYHGIELNGLNSVYIYPEYNKGYGISESVSVEKVKELIENNLDAKLIIITSPSYEGVISDIEGIVSIAHQYGIPVLVDEAHGAHLGFHPMFPKNAVQCGADIVIHSLHKTLPAMTQCALAHWNSEIITQRKFEKELTIFQTSSPSYVLMSSIEQCIDLMIEKNKVYFDEYVTNLFRFSQVIYPLNNLRVLSKGKEHGYSYKNIHTLDIGKIVISTIGSSISGMDLMKMLREKYKIELEMANINYALAMTSICDSWENLKRLADALIEIDQSIEKSDDNHCSYPIIESKQIYSIAKALSIDGKMTDYDELEGCISLEYIWAYPPGIPIIVAGEKISKEHMEVFSHYKRVGIELYSSVKLFPIKLNTSF